MHLPSSCIFKLNGDVEGKTNYAIGLENAAASALENSSSDW